MPSLLVLLLVSALQKKPKENEFGTVAVQGQQRASISQIERSVDNFQRLNVTRHTSTYARKRTPDQRLAAGARSQLPLLPLADDGASGAREEQL